MSAPESTTSRSCPSCRNAMGEHDTICNECRAKLEAHVMSVTAADYPEREPNSSQLTDDLGVPIAAAMDPQLADAVAQDPELLPLAPLDEPRVAALAAGAAASLPAASPRKPAATSSRPPQATAPASRPAPPTPVPVVERPVVLNPTSRWKPIGIAVACIALCAVLAGVIWTFIVPSRAITPIQGTPTTARAK